MEIVILPNSVEVAKFGARRVKALIEKKPAAVLGLATGSTQIALYRELIRCYENNEISFRDVTTFNLDEYIGLNAADSQSYRNYMQREFFEAIDIDESNTFLPTCDVHADPRKAGDAYEHAIAQAGGIDLQMLGIGHNGHVGFNEPTSSLSSRTRIKTLTQNTVAANSRLFGDDEFQPHLAMTMGIGTILDTRSAVLLATGKDKAQAVRDAIEGPVSAMCPASALQWHREVSFVLDEAAAAKLSLADYYRWVHQEKCRILDES